MTAPIGPLAPSLSSWLAAALGQVQTGLTDAASSLRPTREKGVVQRLVELIWAQVMRLCETIRSYFFGPLPPPEPAAPAAAAARSAESPEQPLIQARPEQPLQAESSLPPPPPPSPQKQLLGRLRQAEAVSDRDLILTLFQERFSEEERAAICLRLGQSVPLTGWWQRWRGRSLEQDAQLGIEMIERNPSLILRQVRQRVDSGAHAGAG